MAGTFSSFNTALSAIRYNNTVLQNASNNISNASTEGYVRRRVLGGEIGGPDQPAMYARYDGHGEGVRVADVQRQVDALLDARLRREVSQQSYLDTQAAVLGRVETGIGEPGDNGVAAALAAFKKSWEDLANDPGVDAPRQQVLARASILADTLAAQSRNISGEEADQRVKVLGIVSEINIAARDLAELNEKIHVTELNGIDNNALRDTRDQLALRLSELTGGATTVRADGMFDVSVNGTSLVSGGQAGTFEVTAGINPDGTATGAPIAFGINDGTTTTAVPVAGLRGELGATHDMLATTLPGHRLALNALAADFASTINALHVGTATNDAYDRNGNPGGAFFSVVAGDEAATLQVLITDPDEIAASGIASVGGNLDGGNAHRIFDEAFGAASGEYQRMVNSFGTNVAAVERKAANQAAMTAQVSNSWEAQAGVNLDEETVTMVTAQRAFEAAGKLMTVLDSVLDTLINRTGVTR